jgi:hypothetical protein
MKAGEAWVPKICTALHGLVLVAIDGVQVQSYANVDLIRLQCWMGAGLSIHDDNRNEEA